MYALRVEDRTVDNLIFTCTFSVCLVLISHIWISIYFFNECQFWKRASWTSWLLSDFISGSRLSIRISLFASLLWKKTWFVVQSTSLKMFTSVLRFNKLADHAKKDLFVSKLGESPQTLFITVHHGASRGQC